MIAMCTDIMSPCATAIITRSNPKPAQAIDIIIDTKMHCFGLFASVCIAYLQGANEVRIAATTVKKIDAR